VGFLAAGRDPLTGFGEHRGAAVGAGRRSRLGVGLVVVAADGIGVFHRLAHTRYRKLRTEISCIHGR
jgi:hypothetical protein